jgi:hypothetical protein
MISTPGHRVLRRRQRRALPACWCHTRQRGRFGSHTRRSNWRDLDLLRGCDARDRVRCAVVRGVQGRDGRRCLPGTRG